MYLDGSSREAMAAAVYTVLYTHQKTKKAKVWQDGILKTSGQQAVLYSDKGQHLDTVYVKTGMVNPGDELESDRYLITVEAVGDNTSSTKSSSDSKDVLNFSRAALKPVGLRPPVALKRKFPGFQGPREVTKKPSLDVEDTAPLSSARLAQGCISQSPLLYTTSPLFAAAYGRQAGKDKDLTCSSKHTLASTRNPELGENINVSASPKDTITNGNGVKVIGGERTKQNPRSTAQILALLNTGQKGSVANQLPAPVAMVCSNEAQKTTSMTNDPGVTQPYKLPNEILPVGTKPIKSQWDVYLHIPPASSPAPIDHDDFVMSISPGNQLAISQTDCLMDSEAEEVVVRGLVSTTDIGENKQQSDSHISEPGLTTSQSLTPDSLAGDADEFATDVEDNAGAFSEITFNLMDGFDFTELDDADSTESQPESVSDSTKVCTELTAEQEFLQKESPEKCVNELLKNDQLETTLFHENITYRDVTDIITVSDSSNDEGESTTQSLLKDQSKMALTGDSDIKAEVMTKANVIQIIGKGECLLPYKAEDDHVPVSQIVFPSEDLSKQNTSPKNLDDSSGHHRGKLPFLLPNVSMLHPVQESAEDCNSPELWPSRSNISLLKSLSEPSSALESLNSFSAMCPTRNTDRDAQTYLERVEEQGQDYRFLIRQK